MIQQIPLSNQFSLTVDLVTQTTTIIARRNKGKTYTAGVIAEGVADTGRQFVVLDPVGVWWGLRYNARGTDGKGLDVRIFGGRYADHPLEAGSGKAMAHLVVDMGINCIFDLSGLSKNARTTWAADFAEELFHYKATKRGPLLLIVDEADFFVPQSPQYGDAPRMLGAFDDITRRGRNFGFGCVYITQRAARLNKDVLTQTETLILLGLSGKQDLDAIKEWVKAQADVDDLAGVMQDLPKLPRGTAYVWSPGNLDKIHKVHVKKKRTYDSSSTPEYDADYSNTPSTGSSRPADAEIAKYLEQYVDPKAKKKEAAPAAEAVAPEIQYVDREVREVLSREIRIPVLTTEDREAITAALAKFGVDCEKLAQDFAAGMEAVGREISQQLSEITRKMEAPQQIQVIFRNLDPDEALQLRAIADASEIYARDNPQPVGGPLLGGALQAGLHKLKGNGKPPAEPVQVKIINPGPLTGGPLTDDLSWPSAAAYAAHTPQTDRATLKKKLVALAEWRSLGVPIVTRQQLALWLGVKHTTGTFKQDLRNLADLALLKDSRDGLQLTPLGVLEAGPVERPTSLQDYHAKWYKRLTGGQRTTLEMLIARRGQPLTRDEIAERRGVKSTTGTFKQDLRELVNFGLATFPTDGQVAAGANLFPKGLQ